MFMCELTAFVTKADAGKARKVTVLLTRDEVEALADELQALLEMLTEA